MVYVDPLCAVSLTCRWRWPTACHLFADTLEELHAFAARVGMRRAWFQDHRELPHYDLNAQRRALAVTLGAREVGRREVGLRLRAAREAARA